MVTVQEKAVGLLMLPSASWASTAKVWLALLRPLKLCGLLAAL
jgi:hypothetical protein